MADTVGWAEECVRFRPVDQANSMVERPIGFVSIHEQELEAEFQVVHVKLGSAEGP